MEYRAGQKVWVKSAKYHNLKEDFAVIESVDMREKRVYARGLHRKEPREITQVIHFEDALVFLNNNEDASTLLRRPL